MEINNEHYLNDKSRTLFLNDKLAKGIEEIPRFQELNKLLNTFESNSIVLPMFNTKNEVNNIIDRGKIFGSTDLFMLGRQSQCHSNSAALYLARKDFEDIKIMTGFALSEDGLWRFHSWCILDNMKIIETTEKRLAYFGYILNENIVDLDSLDKETEIISFISQN